MESIHFTIQKDQKDEEEFTTSGSGRSVHVFDSVLAPEDGSCRNERDAR